MTRTGVLSDDMWARIEPLLPPLRTRGRSLRDHRLLVEGAIYRYRTGVAWRDLPAEFGPGGELGEQLVPRGQTGGQADPGAEEER